MKKMCFGSFASVLSRCKATSITQKELIGSMLLAVNEKYYNIDGDDAAVSALVRGKNNLSEEVLLFLDDAAASLPAKFAERVYPLLDANKKGNIVLAFKNILEEDTDIADGTVIELVNGLTKADFLKQSSIVFNDLIVGLFLYVAKYTDNHNKKKYIDEITDTYIKSFESRRSEITFIRSYSLKNEGEVKTVTADAHVMELMAEAGGSCPFCNRTLTNNNSTIIPLGNGDYILLCVECGATVQSSDEKKTIAINIKNEIRTKPRMNDAVANHKLLEEIRELLICLKEISFEDVRLRVTPLRIENKVTDQMLRRKIRGYILDGMYDSINACIENLAAENRLNVAKLSKCVRRMFEDADAESGNQEEIFNAIVEGIHRQSGHVSRNACELLVSYFVQRCEVFNEITE